MDKLFPKGDPEVMQQEYEEREQNPKLGNLGAAPIGPRHSYEEMMSQNNKLDVEVNAGWTGLSCVRGWPEYLPYCPPYCF